MNGDDPIALLQALIRCPSITPIEGGALSLLETQLFQQGFNVTRPIFHEDGTEDVENLFASLGNGGPHLVFAGHTDVVPPGDHDAWNHDPFSGIITDDRIYGRGAVDMKGAIACFLAATWRFLNACEGQFNGRLSFLITGDEEGVAINGTAKLLAWCVERGEQFDACILGEPTNPNKLGDMIKIGRRGSLTGELTVKGIQGHVAYPQQANNPLPGLMKLLDVLIKTPLDSGTKFFQPSNLEITTIDVGNPTANVIPAKATAWFNIRFNDNWTLENLQHEINSRLKTAAQDKLDYNIVFRPGSSNAFVNDGGPLIDILSTAIEAETGCHVELSTDGGTSDARFIKDYCPVVEFGLVSKTIHQVNEHAALADLKTLTAIYERVLRAFFHRS